MEREGALSGREDGDGVLDEGVRGVRLDRVWEGRGQVEGEEVDEVGDEAEGSIDGGVVVDVVVGVV